MRMFLEGEDILTRSNNFRGQFEGQDLVLSVRLELGLGLDI